MKQPRASIPDALDGWAEMVRLIANFDGFLGRKSDGVPGSKAYWEGMEKVRHYAVGIEFMSNLIQVVGNE